LRRYPPVACYVQELTPIPIPASKETPGNKKRSVTGGREEKLGSHTIPQKPNRQAGENNTRTQYPLIPLSRILHPLSECTDHWSIPQLTDQDINSPTSTSSGFVQDEEDIVNTDGDEGVDTTKRHKLVFLDPGCKPVVHKRFGSQMGRPRAIGGMLEMLNSFNAFPVKTTLRNSELFNFCKFPLISQFSSRENRS